MIKILLLLLGGVLVISPLEAQETPPTPSAPFVGSLPANTSWMITFGALPKDPSAPKPADAAALPMNTPRIPALVSVTILRNKGLRREISLWSDKTKWERWIVKNLILSQATGNTFTIGSTELAGMGSAYPDFPDLPWIGKQYFEAVETKNDHPCFRYACTAAEIAAAGDESLLPPEPTKVWIDIESRFPIAIQDQHATRTYTYDLPLTPLSLPPQCREVLAGVEATDKRIAGQKMERPQ